MAKKKAASKTTTKSVETITHAEDKRRNIPTVEYQSVVKQEQQQPVTVKYSRNVDLDPQLVWRGKDQQDWSDLVVHAPPLYIQEKVHPKVLIDDLLRQSQDIKDEEVRASGKDHQLELFSDFNGATEGRSDRADGIACWFIDTDYNEESFFVRHAYFLGQNDPYTALKTTLKAEIDADAWSTLNSDTSRPFRKPKTGRIAVKVINHLGDEVMKVFRVKEVL